MFAYIARESSNIVSVLNTVSNSIIANIAVGNGPDGTAVSLDGSKVYVANYSSNTVSVIDAATNLVNATISVGNSPIGVAISPDGSKVYVSNNVSNTVSVIDASTNTVTATISVTTGPKGVIVSPDGTKAYIANNTGFDVINTATNVVSTSIATGTTPYGIAISPDGSKIYIANDIPGTGTVSVVDTSTNTVIATISVGSNPVAIAITPDGSKVYVGNGGAGTVSVIDTATNTVSATISVGGTGYDPEGVSVTPDGLKVYVLNSVGNTVSVISTASNSVIDTISVSGSPSGLGIFIQQAVGKVVTSISNPDGTTPVSPTVGDTVVSLSPNYYPYGFVNRFRNGTMDVAQRGTSGSVATGTLPYTIDGWMVSVAGSGATVQWQQSTNGGAADPTYSSLGLSYSSGTISDTAVIQRIEGRIAAPLAGQTVTVQAACYNTSGATITPQLIVRHAASLDSWPATSTDYTFTLQPVANNAKVILCYTFAANNASGNGLEITFDFGAALNGSGKAIAVTALDIRATPGLPIGLNANPPLAEMRPISTELAFCQRYYQLVTGFVQSAATGTAGSGIVFAVPMRATPSTTNVAAGSASGVSGSAFDVMDVRSGFYQIYVTSPGGSINARVDSLSAEL